MKTILFITQKENLDKFKIVYKIENTKLVKLNDNCKYIKSMIDNIKNHLKLSYSDFSSEFLIGLFVTLILSIIIITYQLVLSKKLT